MLDDVRLYFKYISVSVRSQMQYRASFVMQSVGQLLITGIDFLGIWALFDRFGGLEGWTLTEVALLYGMVSVAFTFADAMSAGFDLFSATVRNGDFDRMLVRPRSTVLQVIGQELTMRRVGRLAQGTAVLVWAAWAIEAPWSAPKALLLAAAIAGGTSIFVGLFILQGTMCFWTTESLEIMNTLTYGGRESISYPLSIFRPWFRRFFIFVVPLAAVNYFPALAILEHEDPLGTPVVVQWSSPLVGFAFLLVALQVWKIGVRHYRSTGS